MKNKKQIIGVGSFGCDLAHYFNRKCFPADYIYVCDEQDHAKYAESDLQFQHFDHSGLTDSSPNPLPKLENELSLAQAAEVIVSFDCESEADYVFAHTIIKKLKAAGQGFFVYIHYPFYSPGNKKLNRLQEIERLIEDPHRFFRIDREIYARYGMLKFSDAFEAVFEEIGKQVLSS